MTFKPRWTTAAGAAAKGVILLAAATMTLQADQLVGTWLFQGQCSDCFDDTLEDFGTGHGTLTIWDPFATTSVDVARSRFRFDFSYTSPWIHYDLQGVRVSVCGLDCFVNPSPFDIPADADVYIDGFGTIYTSHSPTAPPDDYNGPISFWSGGGDWSTGPNGNQADIGSGGSWSSASVPEIDPGSASGAVSLLATLLLISRAPRRLIQ